MLSPVSFPYITYGLILKNSLCNSRNFVINWLAFGKLPENTVVTPSSSIQVIQPSSENRFLQTVTVEAIPTTTTQG